MKRSLLLVVLMVCAPTPALADVIMPPPDNLACRPGERLVNDHGGARCELPFCEDQAGCPDGTRCPQRHCYAMVPSTYEGCPGVPEDSKEPPDPCDPVRETRGPCADEAPRCPDGESCGLAQCEWIGTPPAPQTAADEDEDSEGGESETGDPDESDPPAARTEPAPSGGCSASRRTDSSAAWLIFGLGLAGVVIARKKTR